MSELLVGLGVAGGLLTWVLFRYFTTQKRLKIEAVERRIKEDKYQNVLEKARFAAREEKIYKAQTGHILSQLSLAKEYELTNVHEAIKWYFMAAIQENIIAQNALARLCRMDCEDPDGAAKSAYWTMVIKAKQQDPAAQFELGQYQVRGHGTDIDVDGGITNVLIAAEAGYLPAQLFLSDWYVSDKALCKDPHEAFHWRVNAAIQNDPRACIKTAYCYQAGIGVVKDKSCAVYWLERAAEQDDAEAQQLAAKMHLGSDANDAAVAYIWYSLAVVNGHPLAKEARDKIAQSIGIDEIRGVQNVANTIYKMIKQDNYMPNMVINVLDRVYGRKGYRPTNKMLVALARREYTIDLDSKPNDDNSKEVPVATPDVSHNKESTNSDENSPLNITVANEYRDQSWQASWGSFMNETDKT